MFTSGIVKQENMDFWNAELKTATDARVAAEKRRANVSVEIPKLPDGFFEEFEQKMTAWALSLDQCGDDYALKHTLVNMLDSRRGLYTEKPVSLETGSV